MPSFDHPPFAQGISSTSPLLSTASRPAGMVQPALSPIAPQSTQIPSNSSQAPPSSIPSTSHAANTAMSKGLPHQVPVQIRTVFMPEAMQAKAVELAKEACTNERMAGSPREIAGHLKLAFDTLYGPAWHCVVGRSFGSFVTHEKDSFIFFYIDQWAIMLFRTTPSS